eukprot:186003_1
MKGMFKAVKRRFSSKDSASGRTSSPRDASSDVEQKSSGAPSDGKGRASGRGARGSTSRAGKDGKRDSSRSSSLGSRSGPVTVLGGANPMTSGGSAQVGIGLDGTLNGVLILAGSGPDGEFVEGDLKSAEPSLREEAPANREALFVKKLKMCCVIFNFQVDREDDHVGKEIKRLILLEMVDYISTNKKWFSEPVLQAIIEMVSANLFRALPPPSAESFDPDEDDPIQDPAYSHLQIVFEFLLRFVVSTDTDTKMLKRYINPPFVLNILELFDSEDARERDYLKTILHRIYGKFMSLRSFIRKAINNVFFRFIYESEGHNGIGELLEILGSIINGFALPLKHEHKNFLRNVLVPLHKVKKIDSFHQNLAYCVAQFVDKDQRLSIVVISGLLAYWPVTNTSKEVMYLIELEEVLELTQSEEFQTIAGPLFKRISLCISSPHFQVAERALFLWNNEYIASLTSEHARIVLPILYPSLHENTKNHWNPTVLSLTCNITKMFMEMNSDLYEKVRDDYEKVYNINNKANAKQKRVTQWGKVSELARGDDDADRPVQNGEVDSNHISSDVEMTD